MLTVGSTQPSFEQSEFSHLLLDGGAEMYRLDKPGRMPRLFMHLIMPQNCAHGDVALIRACHLQSLHFLLEASRQGAADCSDAAFVCVSGGGPEEIAS